MWIFTNRGTVSLTPCPDNPQAIAIRSRRAEDLCDFMGVARLRRADVKPDPVILGEFVAVVGKAAVLDAISDAMGQEFAGGILRRVDLFDRAGFPADPDTLDYLLGP